MPETAQRLIGQLADGRFPLRKLLGVSSNSAVFLTSLAPAHPGDGSPDAAIKLIPEDSANSDTQLDRWRAAAAFSHPGLLRILHFGRCNIDGSPCLYIVSELADENLSQLLPTRALTPDETRGMLGPVLSALDSLHESGFVHAGLKPSNIHAVGDNVKLSADRILSEGESSSSWPLAAPYAAPESILFPASDLWSLGVSLCETLTRNLPAQDSTGRFMLPDLPAPFSEIIHTALVEDATVRGTLDQVRSLLDPSFVPKRKPAPAMVPASAPESAPVAEMQPATVHAAKSQAAVAAASSGGVLRQPLPQIDPLAVPLSQISPSAAPQPARTRIPVSSLPQVNATIAGSRRVSTPLKSSSSNTLVLVGAAAAVLLAVLFIPRYFLRATRPASPASAGLSGASTTPENSRAAKPPEPSSTPASSSVPTNPPTTSKSSTVKPMSESAQSQTETTAAKKLADVNSTAASPDANSAGDLKNSSAPDASAPTNSSRVATSTSPAASPTHSASPNVKPLAPAVLRKVLPVVSEKARATISGTVRINVRVQLNPDGTVSAAELANSAGSQFFADLALKAAQQWQFGPPVSDDTAPVPTSAVIRFDFTQITTSAYVP